MEKPLASDCLAQENTCIAAEAVGEIRHLESQIALDWVRQGKVDDLLAYVHTSGMSLLFLEWYAHKETPASGSRQGRSRDRVAEGIVQQNHNPQDIFDLAVAAEVVRETDRMVMM